MMNTAHQLLMVISVRRPNIVFGERLGHRTDVDWAAAQRADPCACAIIKYVLSERVTTEPAGEFC